MELGDKVRDKVTGFEGIAVARTRYLNGCTRFGVHPGLDKDGKIRDIEWFDEPQLEIMQTGAVVINRTDAETGGPLPYPVKNRDNPR